MIFALFGHFCRFGNFSFGFKSFYFLLYIISFLLHLGSGSSNQILFASLTSLSPPSSQTSQTSNSYLCWLFYFCDFALRLKQTCFLLLLPCFITLSLHNFRPFHSQLQSLFSFSAAVRCICICPMSYCGVCFVVDSWHFVSNHRFELLPLQFVYPFFWRLFLEFLRFFALLFELDLKKLHEPGMFCCICIVEYYLLYRKRKLKVGNCNCHLRLSVRSVCGRSWRFFCIYACLS